MWMDMIPSCRPSRHQSGPITERCPSYNCEQTKKVAATFGGRATAVLRIRIQSKTTERVITTKLLGVAFDEQTDTEWPRGGITQQRYTKTLLPSTRSPSRSKQQQHLESPSSDPHGIPLSCATHQFNCMQLSQTGIHSQESFEDCVSRALPCRAAMQNMHSQTYRPFTADGKNFARKSFVDMPCPDHRLPNLIPDQGMVRHKPTKIRNFPKYQR